MSERAGRPWESTRILSERPTDLSDGRWIVEVSSESGSTDYAQIGAGAYRQAPATGFSEPDRVSRPRHDRPQHGGQTAVPRGKGMSKPDLAPLVTGAARIVADRLCAAGEQAGVDDMRSSFGFVVRVLSERDRTLTELEELLSVSKQVAIKVVDEMEARGYLERRADPADRQAKVLRLTAK